MDDKQTNSNPIEARTLRDALGQFPTGVTVITCFDAEGNATGMTASSFNALSLDPALVLWSIGKNSSNFDAFNHCSHFNIHILKHDQGALAYQFASKEGDRFANVELENPALLNSKLHNFPQRAPALSDSLVRLECAMHANHDGGDHRLLIGRVEKLQHNDGEAIAFYRGKFAGLSA